MNALKKYNVNLELVNGKFFALTIRPKGELIIDYLVEDISVLGLLHPDNAKPLTEERLKEILERERSR